MEFMSLGVPVIVSRTKIDSFYHDQSMVRFFESENDSDLAEAIFQFWREPQLRSALARNGLSYVQKNNWETKKREYLDMVDGLLGSRVSAQAATVAGHARSARRKT